MVYSTSRCPSCGQIIRRQTNPVKEIGIPFERCRWCGKPYLNSYKEEWITKSPIKRFFFFLQIGVWARAFIVPVLILLIPLAALDASVEILRVLWPLSFIAWLVGGYFVHKKAEQNDIAASLERTKDTEYLNLLKQAGYKIYPIAHQSTPVYIYPQTTTHAKESVTVSKEIRFCRKCGQNLVSGSLYCNKCGEKVIVNHDKE